MGPLGCSLPVEMPKSFEPIFMKVRKAAKKPKTAKRYILRIKYLNDHNVDLKINLVQSLLR